MNGAGWVFWAVSAAVFAAATAILAKVGLRDIDSDFATLIRTVVIVAVLGIFVALTGKWSNPFALDTRALTFLVLSGLATGASWVCYFRALQLGDVARVAPVDKLSVVLVAVFAVVFLGERLSWRDVLGIALVACGALLLALKR